MQRAGPDDTKLVFRDNTVGAQGPLTHNLPDGDRLGQGGRLAAPRDVDPNHPEDDFRSRGEVLDGEATALNGLRVGRDPLIGCKRQAMPWAFPPAPPRSPSAPCPFPQRARGS